MPRSTADQTITIACSLLAVATLALGGWVIYRRLWWYLLVVVPVLALLGIAIYFFGFFRFTRLF
ncbi:MAG: hypothetical protein ABJC19_06070 [Gemmatimonadota bacterium]